MTATPTILLESKNWVLHRNKQPCNNLCETTGWDNPEFWGTYEQVSGAYVNNPGVFDGIGFVTHRDPARWDLQIVGGDLDNCRDPVTGWVSPNAEKILRSINCPCAISLSGCGFRYFCLGKLPDDLDSIKGQATDDLTDEAKQHITEAKKNSKKGPITFNGFEVYVDGRFLTVTETWLPDFPSKMEDRTSQLSEICEPFLKEIAAEPVITPRVGGGGSSLPHLDILTVINTAGFKKSGDNYYGPHPILGSSGGHNLSVNPTKGWWHCFKAGYEGGGDSWLWIAGASRAVPWEDCKKGLRWTKDIVDQCKEYVLANGWLSEDVLFPERKVLRDALAALKNISETALKEDPELPFDKENLDNLKIVNKQDQGAFLRLMREWRTKVPELKSTKLTETVEKAQKADERQKSSDDEKPSPAKWIVDHYMGNNYELWHTPDKVAYITVDGEHLPVKSSDFSALATTTYNSLTGEVLSKSLRDGAIDTLVGYALRSEHTHDIYVRVTKLENDSGRKIYIDLANEDREVIEITKDNWNIIKDPPVRFRRPLGIQPLPHPERGGTLEEVRSVMNLDVDQWILVKGYIVGLLNPDGSYAVLVLIGGTGRLKSLMVERIKKIIDPHFLNIDSCPETQKDRIITYNENHVVTFDNVSYLPQSISNEFCKVSSGVGFRLRTLFTNMESILVKIRKPIILNGIKYFVTKGDLINRVIMIEPPLLTTYELTEIADKKFDDMHPRLLGALLDLVKTGLQNRVSTPINTRMSDFAQWTVACLGPEEGQKFMDLYTENKNNILKSVTAGNLLIEMLVSFMEERPDGWEGTATDLLENLVSRSAGREKPIWWPKIPRSLSSKLNEFDTEIRDCGIVIEHVKQRTLRITRTSDDTGDESEAELE